MTKSQNKPTKDSKNQLSDLFLVAVAVVLFIPFVNIAIAQFLVYLLIASATGWVTAKLLHENGAGYAVGLITLITLLIYGIY